MKKFAIPMLIGLILSAFAFTGCNETLIAPEDEWCVVTTKVQNQDIDLYFYYTTSSNNKVSFKGVNGISEDKTIAPGLTIVAISNIIPTGEASTAAYMKTFGTNQEVTLDDSEGTKVTFKAPMWDALYIKLYKKGIRKTTADGFRYCTEATTWSKLGDEFINITWKDIVIDVLELL